MTTADAERLKLTASWLNTLAANAIAAGVIAPLAAYVYGLTPAAFDGRVIAVAAIFIVVGCGLHHLARLVLKGLT